MKKGGGAIAESTMKSLLLHSTCRKEDGFGEKGKDLHLLGEINGKQKELQENPNSD